MYVYIIMLLWRGSPQHSICSRLLLKSLDLSIVPFCGQFVGVVKAIEPPPQQMSLLQCHKYFF
jgi:hypothetical protein